MHSGRAGEQLKHIRNQLHDIHHLLSAMQTEQTEDIVAATIFYMVGIPTR